MTLQAKNSRKTHMDERIRRAFPRVEELLTVIRDAQLSLSELDVLVEEIQTGKSDFATLEPETCGQYPVRGRKIQTEK